MPLFLALAMLVPGAASAKAIVAEGVRFSPDRPVKVAVFRPEVSVGALSIGGVDQPSVEWTTNARKFMADALEKSQAARANKIVFVADPTGEDRVLIADYTALFRAVSDAIITHKMFPGNKLPTKKNRFDWTMGAGTSQLRALAGEADYGLFFYTYDAYGTADRKAAQILGAVLGFGLMPAGVHVGYAGLVELKSGKVVWFNTDVSMGGDVRTPDGATKRVSQLLRGFPGTAPEPEGAVK